MLRKDPSQIISHQIKRHLSARGEVIIALRAVRLSVLAFVDLHSKS
jgi:hypothetical protein